MIVTHKRAVPQGLAREGGQNSAYGQLRHLIIPMSSYLVTGGAGFIGSHLAEELTRRGNRVRVVDSFITGKRRNLAHLPGVELLDSRKDRKSTRLNSSHMSISYAVFCLKKKKKQK